MKNIRSVFILLIGMISLTAFATTSKLDQKPTTVLTTDKSVMIDTVNVDYTFDVVSFPMDAAFSQCIFIVSNQKIVKPSLVIISDVGWQSENLSFEQIGYNEKLLENYNLSFTSLKKAAATIRNDC